MPERETIINPKTPLDQSPDSEWTEHLSQEKLRIAQEVGKTSLLRRLISTLAFQKKKEVTKEAVEIKGREEAIADADREQKEEEEEYRKRRRRRRAPGTYGRFDPGSWW